MDNAELLIVVKGRSSWSAVYYIEMNCSHLGRDAMTIDDKIAEERHTERRTGPEPGSRYLFWTVYYKSYIHLRRNLTRGDGRERDWLVVKLMLLSLAFNLLLRHRRCPCRLA